MHVIAAKAVCFKEAENEEFKRYQNQVVKNASVLGETLKGFGFDLVSGGTDNHLILADLRSKNLTGHDAEVMLDDVGITVNKNMVPFDPQTSRITSGIRIGTPAVTSRGMGEAEMERLGRAIDLVLSYSGEQGKLLEARRIVQDLCASFPIYS